MRADWLAQGAAKLGLRLNCLLDWRRFGIECADELEWRSWQPGGEYVRNLIVKNVSQQIQKISYRLPASKVFSMGYPVPLKLSPGMSYPIRVRPDRYAAAYTCN